MSGRPLREFGLHRDAVLHRFQTGDLNHLADRCIDLQAIPPWWRLLDEGADPADDVACSIAVLDDVSEHLPHLVEFEASEPSSQRSAAWALVIVAAMGWFTSWAIEAVSCPMVATRFACASSICTSR